MDTLFKNSFFLRLVSALILIPIAIGAVVMGNPYFAGFLIILFALSVYEWVGIARKVKNPVKESVIGVCYIAVCLASLYAIRMTGEGGLYHTIIFLVTVWSVDSGAYVFGKFLGKKQLVPSISPKKTWAGFYGGIASGTVAILVLSYLLLSIENESLISVALSGVVLSVIGQFGDMLVSKLKREANVKDSGTLIPGHGGVLDRIDALMLMAPFYLLLMV